MTDLQSHHKGVLPQRPGRVALRDGGGARGSLGAASHRLVWTPIALATVLLAIPAMAQEGAPVYHLGTGDVLQITVVGEPDLSVAQTIGPDGRISFSPLGMVEAGGKTPEALADELRLGLIEAKWLIDPIVTVSVGAYNSTKINIVGAVVTPGQYQHEPLMTIRAAIARAGGLTSGGDVSKAPTKGTVIHADGSSVAIDLQQALAGIGPSGEMKLLPGDTLVIEAPDTVMVFGEVTREGSFPAYPAMPISRLISDVGGATEEGDLEHVTIRGADGELRVVDVQAIIRGEAEAEEVTLNPGDLVFVPRASREVKLLGYVQKQGEFAIREDMRVSDLIAQAGGPTRGGAQRSDMSSVVVTSADGTSRTLDLTPVLTGAAPSNDQNDPILQPGDTVFVPMLRAEIMVLGQVTSPGAFEYMDGMTATDALAKAGGAIVMATIRPLGRTTTTTLTRDTTSADLSRCRIYRTTGEVVEADLSGLGRAELPSERIPMYPGDTLVVPATENTIVISGYVQTPGYYEFGAGLTLREAIAAAGDVIRNEGSTSQVEVQHSDGTTEIVNIDVEDLELRPGDRIRVPYARYRVLVTGYVKSPGVYEWHEGDRVLDLLYKAGGAIISQGIEGDFFHAAVIRRSDAGEDQLIKLDFGPLYDRGVQEDNILLEPGDIILIPESDHFDYDGWFSTLTQGFGLLRIIDSIF